MIDVVAAATGGGLARARELARTLPKLDRGHDFVFVARRDVAPTLQAIAPGLEVIVPPRFVSGAPARILWEHTILPARLRGDSRPEVVFSPFNFAPGWWSATGVKTVVLVSNLAPYSPEVRSMYRDPTGAARLEGLRRLTDRSLARAERVFVLSHQAFSLIDRRMLEGKTEVVPIAPPAAEATTSDPGWAPSEPFLLIATDLMRYKGIELVIEALAGLSSVKRPLLLIAGRPLESSYVRRLERLLADHRLAGRVRFLGPVEHGALLALQRRAVAAIVPSRFENGARAAVEPMALGVPVIAARIPGLTEACGDAAVYFEPGRADELAGSMRRLVDDPEYRRERGDAGRRRVEAISPQSTAEKLVQTFERLAAGD